jgi:ABC-type sugar transport system ATPase subunit
VFSASDPYTRRTGRLRLAAITMSDVTVVLGDVPVLRGCELAVADGEFFVLIGRSGAGKSSILRAIAGLVPVVSGAVRYDGVDVTAMPTHRRDLGIVFQGDALFPHHDVRSNIGFPLRIRRARPEDRMKRVLAEARALGVDHLLERMPGSLSAGQQQLVQIARAVVRRPRVLLMDEPLADVDIETRRAMREIIVTLQRGYGVTTIYATNEPVEAMTMADRLGVVGDGAVVQAAAPSVVRDMPVDRHTALLTGAIALVPAVVTVDATGPVVVAGELRLRGWAVALRAVEGEPVTLGLRPDDVVAGREFVAHVVSRSIADRRAVTWLDAAGTRIMSATVAAERGAHVACALVGGLVFDDSGGLITAIGR